MLKQKHSKQIPGIDVSSMFQKIQKLDVVIEEEEQIVQRKKRKPNSPVMENPNDVLKEFSF
jgi:hypothetical protein